MLALSSVTDEEQRCEDVSARVMRAIHEHRLGEVAGEWLADGAPALSDADRRLLESAHQACADIHEQLVVEGQAMAERLRASNVPCTFDSSTAVPRHPQYHELTLDIGAEHLATASQVAAAVGYWHPLLDDTRAWAELPHTRTSVVLKRPDDRMTRIALRWRRAPGVVARLRSGLNRLRQRLLPGGAPQPSERSLGGFIGTPRPLLPELFAFANLTRDDVLLDLGCGDGRVLVEAAERIGCRGLGLENDPRIQTLAAAAVAGRGLEELVEIELADANSAPLPEATVIFLFVPAAAIASYVPTFLKRARPGTRLLVHEQDPIVCTPASDKSAPLIVGSAMTVVHLWIA